MYWDLMIQKGMQTQTQSKEKLIHPINSIILNTRTMLIKNGTDSIVFNSYVTIGLSGFNNNFFHFKGRNLTSIFEFKEYFKLFNQMLKFLNQPN